MTVMTATPPTTTGVATVSRYAKALAAIVGAVATWATTFYPGDANVQKWVGLAVAIATVASVYLVPNAPAAGEPAEQPVDALAQVHVPDSVLDAAALDRLRGIVRTEVDAALENLPKRASLRA